MQSVLVIDDERNVREALKRVLDRAGFTTRTAESVEDGLAQLRAAMADVVVTDIIMPDIDGVAAIETIKRDFGGVKIIAISGGGNFDIATYQPAAITTSAYLAAAARGGADCILTKPFESKELIEAIETALGFGHA